MQGHQTSIVMESSKVKRLFPALEQRTSLPDVSWMGNSGGPGDKWDPRTCSMALVIPVLNEEEAIMSVLQGLPEGFFDHVIVADNGSTDTTAACAKQAGAIVVYEPRKGYGYACQAGVQAALDRHADIIVFMDGDLSDDPADDVRSRAELSAPVVATGTGR